MKHMLLRPLHQSAPMAVAMLALFVALTGTAVATSSALITGKQIKNGSITGADVRNKSLTSRDIRGQLRGPRGLPGAPGAKGETGDKGDKGDKGETGPSNGFSVANSTVPLPWSGIEQVVTALALPAGKYVLNGHVNANNNGVTSAIVSCRIILGGTTVGQSELVRLGSGGTFDSQVVAITAGGTLAISGVAQLRCIAPTTFGNFPARGFTAVQVATLNGS